MWAVVGLSGVIERVNVSVGGPNRAPKWAIVRPLYNGRRIAWECRTLRI